MPQQQERSLRTRRFLERIELGANIQFARPTGLLPQTSEIAFQAGYRFSKRSSAGLGVSYRAGFGNGLQNLRLSHEGIGFRSFIDYRIRNQFFLYAGAELIHHAAFDRIEQLRDIQNWQHSALLGLSQRYNISRKLRGNLLVVYDFLHRFKTPAAPAFQFRFGYNF
jgi:hypothetical protein